MGYVFDFKEATHYDAWFSQPGNRHCFDLEIKLIQKLMDLRSGQRILAEPGIEPDRCGPVHIYAGHRP